VITAVVVLALPVAAPAQEATLSGTVNDTQGGVLPGVTITATNEDSRKGPSEISHSAPHAT